MSTFKSAMDLPSLYSLGVKQSSLSMFTCCLAIILFACYILFSLVASSVKTRQFSAQNGCQPIRARQHVPWFGIFFLRDTIQALEKKVYLASLTERYFSMGSNTHEMTSLGRRAVFTIDPVNLKTMLSLKSKDYSIGNRLSVMGPLLGRAIFVTDGGEWSHSRAVLRPSFNKTQVANLSIIESHFQHLLKQLCASVVEGEDAATIDLQELFLRFTMDSSTEFLFGESTNTLTAGDHAFSNAFTYSLRDISLSLRMGPWAKFRRTDPKAAESHRICREYVDRYADQALRYRRKIDSGDSKQDDNETSILIKELANATGDRERIRDELLGLLLAGRDTTASLLSSLFFCLAKRPDVWDKVREEVANELPNGSLPTYDQLKSIKYARYCINETLRLYPPIPNNGKIAVKDTVLPRGGGPNGDAPILIKKGTPVFFTVYAMHRREDIYGEDANEFCPERWGKDKFTWEYLPFNGGPRICLGQQYALTEALYVLIRFAQEFETIEPRDEAPWTEELALTVSCANGVKVSLKQSSSQR